MSAEGAHGADRVAARAHHLANLACQHLGLCDEVIVQALRASHPKLRTPGEAISIPWDTEFFKNVFNVTLSTDMGPVDLLAEAPGVEGFVELWTRSQEMQLFGLPVRVASVDDLIRMKLATGRPKDTEHAMQLQALKKIVEKGSTE